MPTPVQRKVCAWIVENGGEMSIASGHKTVRRGTIRSGKYAGQTAVAGNLNLIDGLMNNRFVEQLEWGRYRITDAGRKIARAEP